MQAQLLEALRRTRLVGEEEDYSDVSYSRCGRTDRGVSALSQVGEAGRRRGSTEQPLAVCLDSSMCDIAQHAA